MKKEAFEMWRGMRRRKADLDTDEVRGGTGPKDNLVVLITSLAILAAAGAFLLWYFGFVPHHPAP
jgi:hypothetical protein